jgi:hypothetical protein
MTRPFEVLFLSNFSDLSYRSIPALAQMADELDMRITIAHALPVDADGSNAKRKLDSFFPEADGYHGTQRLLSSGDVVEMAKWVCSKQQVDLIVAPCADPLGLPRPWNGSTRNRLLTECHVPLWTIGRQIQTTIFQHPTRNVGCWVDLDSPDTTHISLAFEYASKLGARLHLLHSLPESSENLLTFPLFSAAPLHESAAREAILTLLGWMPVQHEIHIGSGGIKTVLPKMGRDLALDALFVGASQAVHKGWFGTGISSAINRCPCPVVCSAPGGMSAAWHLNRGPALLNQKIASKAA